MFNIKNLKNLDYFMFFAMLMLLSAGWFAVYSASYEERMVTGIDYSYKQLVWICIALAVFFITVIIDYHFLLKASFVIYVLVVLLLLAVLFFGESRYGAKRWLRIGGLSLQPSEIAKVGVILAVAKYLVMDIGNRMKLKYIIICGLILGIPMLLVLKQPDLGTALVFIPTVLIMLFVVGIGFKNLFCISIVGLAGMPAAWFVLKDYQKQRLLSFLNPNQDPLGSGYSLIQSKIAVGSGGLFGKGWLSGTQNRLSFLPERHTDFVFSIIGEEWGFAGAVMVISLFFIIIALGFKITHKAPDLSGKILAVGLISLFSIQLAINIGMTIGLMPVTGLPLPLISYGGTSMIVNAALLGLLQNIYMRRFMF